MMEEMRFSQSDAQNKIFPHIPARSLLLMATSGVIEWVDEYSDGRGVHRVYSLANLYQIAVATQLSLVGFSYHSIKTLVMDRLKGLDEAGEPKILKHMTKLLGIKVGEERLKKRRFPLFNVVFEDPENIDQLTRKLFEPFEVPELVQKLVGAPVGLVQPVTALIISLPQVAAQVDKAVELFLKG